MAKLSAKNGVLLVGGYLLSSSARSYTIDASTTPLEVTGFGDQWRNYIPGIYTGSMGAEFYFDSAANSANAALQSISGAKYFTIIPEGFTLGTPAFSMKAVQGKFTPGAAVSDVLMSGNINFQTHSIDGGPWPGWALAHATITSTTTTTGFVDPTDGAVTARCGAFLHIWTPCAADTYVVTVEHSTALGSGYATLLTFTSNGSARAGELVTAASGTINKYRRVVATRTGAAGNPFGYSVVFWHSAF